MAAIVVGWTIINLGLLVWSVIGAVRVLRSVDRIGDQADRLTQTYERIDRMKEANHRELIALLRERR